MQLRYVPGMKNMGNEMKQKENILPSRFLWGAATAAHQVEGGITTSDQSLAERAEPSFFSEASGDAVDHYARFDDDMALVSALGLNTYRFSIEWARIEPSEGDFNLDELAHYQHCIDACLLRGIKPMITFHHFTFPAWVARAGGLHNKKFPDWFTRYCAKVASILKGFTHACTMNELNIPHYIVASKALSLDDPTLQPKLVALEKAFGGPAHGMFLLAGKQAVLEQGLLAHQKSRLAIKEKYPDIPVGVTLSIQEEGAEPGAEALCKQRRDELYGPYLSAVKRDDFIGVQTYSRVISRTDGSTGPIDGAELTMMGYEYRPEALGHVLEYVWQETKTPLIVTENGFAGEDDSKRANFINRSITGMKTAIESGVQVDGYLYWSLFDNYEWMHGYKPRFGIIAVDRTTQRRLIKPSALMLAHHATQGTLSAEITPLSLSTTGAPIGIG